MIVSVKILGAANRNRGLTTVEGRSSEKPRYEQKLTAILLLCFKNIPVVILDVFAPHPFNLL